MLKILPFFNYYFLIKQIRNTLWTNLTYSYIKSTWLHRLRGNERKDVSRLLLIKSFAGKNIYRMFVTFLIKLLLVQQFSSGTRINADLRKIIYVINLPLFFFRKNDDGKSFNNSAISLASSQSF